MNPVAVRAATALLRGLCRRRPQRFHEVLAQPGLAQRLVLARLVQGAATTEYGRLHGLRAGDDIDAFRAKLPLVRYEALAPFIARQRLEGSRILGWDKVGWYERTSGSSGPAKDIPYTVGLRHSFQSLFQIWAYDLLSHGFAPRTGKLFFSISAPTRSRDTEDPRRPAGRGDDSAYLSGLFRGLLQPFFAVPVKIARITGSEDFRDVLSTLLIACEGLELVSIWSPSYLIVLLEHFQTRRERLLAALATGVSERQGIRFAFEPLRTERRTLLESAGIDWSRVWPRLQLISCWDAAAAERGADYLRQRFPHTRVQGKGLLATEAPVSVPLWGAAGAAPLVDELLLEFEGEDGRLYLIDEIAVGACYQLIVSQPGGLLRYRLGDWVKVTAPIGRTPGLVFAGRAQVADLVGEKLHEDWVNGILRRCLPQARCALLLPVQQEDGRGHYLLLTDAAIAPATAAVEAALGTGYHYRQARELGQLDTLQALTRPDMLQRVREFFSAQGMLAGDIKDQTLLTDPAAAARLVNWLARQPPATVNTA